MESYYNWARAVSPPPKNGTNVEGCGCYIVKKDERWMTYTYHHLCEDHMIDHILKNVWLLLKDINERLLLKEKK